MLWEGPGHCRHYLSWVGGLGVYKKTSHDKHGKKVGKQGSVSFVASGSVPDSSFLPWVPALTSLVRDYKLLRWQLAFGHSVYHSNRMQTRTKSFISQRSRILARLKLTVKFAYTETIVLNACYFNVNVKLVMFQT